MPTGSRYILITPCRDEAAYLPTTIATIAAQTVRPAKWIVVDDGSTDDTTQILLRAAAEHDFIEVLRREDRGCRKVGPGVVDAFYAGLERVDLNDYDFVCKMDGDLELPPRCFETLIRQMHAEPRLGTVSGKVYLRDSNGNMTHEKRGDENSVGPCKFYRAACFKDIGGFVREVGWDGIDGHMCRLHNWIARSTDLPETRVIHLRQMGSSDCGVLRGRMRAGEGMWFIGYSPIYVMARTVNRLLDAPLVIGSLFVALGYFRAMFGGKSRFGDQPYRQYLRRFERDSLLHGKRRTIERFNDMIRATAVQAEAAPQ